MWLTRLAFLLFCGYPAEKPASAALVNVATDRGHPTQPAPKADPPGQFADKLGKPIHKENAGELGDQSNEIIQLEHGLTVALSRPTVKAGKCVCPAIRAK